MRASREFLFEWPLKSYKHFLDTLEGNVPPEEATQKYEQYTAEFNRRHLRKFFDEYKSHEWMKERHHPEKLERLQAHLTKRAQEQAKLFAQELEEGKLHPCFDHPDADGMSWFFSSSRRTHTHTHMTLTCVNASSLGRDSFHNVNLFKYHKLVNCNRW